MTKTKTDVTTKTFATRDSATALLKKLGVPVTNYALFIQIDEAAGKKSFTVDIDFVKESLKDLGRSSNKASKTEVKDLKKLFTEEPKAEKSAKAPKTEKTEKAPKAEKVAKVKTAKTPARTISSAAREYILAGLDNNTVFGKLVDEFKLDANKKYYPAWYRCELRKAGHKV